MTDEDKAAHARAQAQELVEKMGGEAAARKATEMVERFSDGQGLKLHWQRVLHHVKQLIAK